MFHGCLWRLIITTIINSTHEQIFRSYPASIVTFVGGRSERSRQVNLRRNIAVTHEPFDEPQLVRDVQDHRGVGAGDDRTQVTLCYACTVAALSAFYIFRYFRFAFF